MSGTSVSSGVTSSGLVLSNGGVLDILSGGTAISTTVSAGGVVYVSRGGSVSATVVTSRGLVEVLSGGIVSGTVLSGYGTEQVYGASVSATVDYAGSQLVLAGGTATGSVVAGSEVVASGGVTIGIRLMDGYETVSSGGVAIGSVVAFASGGASGNGQIYVSSGGTMQAAVVNHNGYAGISRGAVAIGTTLSGGGEGVAGGTAIGTTIGLGGIETVSVVYVFSTGDYLSGVASATTIAGGTLDLEGGSATGGILFAGSGPGLLEVSGTVMPATAISGFASTDAIDLQSVADTGSGTVSLNAATDVLMVTEGGSSVALQLAGSYAGTIFSLSPDNGSGTIIAINHGSATDVSSGVTSQGIVLSNGGVLDVLSGGTALSTTVSAGGIVAVSRGGSAVATTVSSRGLLEVLSGGVASETVLSGYGSEEVHGASVSATVGYAASQFVFAGGTATGSVVQGSEVVASGGVTIGTQLIDGSETVASGGVASGTVVAAGSGNGQITVASGGTMQGAVVNHDGFAGISGGGVAVGTTLSGGDEGVAGGTAIRTTIGLGGIETVSVVYVPSASAYEAGVTSATTIAGGTLYLEGGSATGGILFAGSGPGVLEISGTAMPATAISGFASTDAIDLQSVADTGSGTVSLNASTDVLTVTEGGSSTVLQLAGSYAGITFNLSPDAGSGTLIEIDHGSAIAVASGVTSDGLVLSNGSVLNVLSGGTATSIVVGAGGVVDVSRGGSAVGTVVTSRGLVEILSGGVASETVLSGYGHEEVHGASISATVGYAASQFVFAGGTATGSLVQGTEVVAAGGVTVGVQLIDGSETVASGGVASGTVVGAASGNGQITVASGGTMQGTIVERDGYAGLSGGAVAIGTTLSGGGEGLAGGTAIGTTIDLGGIETVSVVYSPLASGFATGVASATTIAGGTLDLEGGSATGGILFTGSGPGLLEISGTVMPATAISGFASTDAIDLQSVADTGSATVSLNASTDVLTVAEGGLSFALQLAGSYAGTTFNLEPDTGLGTLIIASTSGTVVGTSGVPCFAAGTRIAAERGSVAVEHLIIGDRLATVEGEMKAITWIGSRRVDCRRHPEPMKVWPVHVAVNAFGAGAPCRELLLSPDHAVFAEGVLIPVKHLINGTTVRQIATLAVTYFHVELSPHSVILAEGLAVESYLDSGDRRSFETTDGVVTLHPSFASEHADIAIVMDALGYAPLRVTGPEVAAVQARLAEHVPRGFGRIHE